MFSDSARLQLRKRPDLSIRTLQNDKAHKDNAAACALWIYHIQDFLCWIGRTWWHWLMLLCTLDQMPSWQLSGEIFNVYTGTSPSMSILQVRTGMNTLVGTNQDKKWPGTHLGLNVWLSSALRVPICSFPASKRNDNPLRTIANWSGGPTLNVSDLKCNSLPFVTEPPQTQLDATTSL